MNDTKEERKGRHIRISQRLVFLFFGFFKSFSRAAPMAYVGSQARGLIRAVATGLHRSHSSAGSEPRLQPTPQLRATPDPSPTEQGQGSNPHPIVGS